MEVYTKKKLEEKNDRIINHAADKDDLQRRVMWVKFRDVANMKTLSAIIS